MGKSQHARRKKAKGNHDETINHVYTTRDGERLWLVKTSEGDTRWVRAATANRLITSGTTWQVRKIGPNIRHGRDEPVRRCVFWEGFKGHTEEPFDFHVEAVSESLFQLWRRIDGGEAID